MKKIKTKTVLIIVIAFIAFEASCIVGHYFLEKRIHRSQTEALCNEIENYMKSDEIFETNYGKVISVKPDPEKDRESVGSQHLRIPCIVETESNVNYYVLVDYIVKDDNEVIFDYYSINAIETNNQMTT